MLAERARAPHDARAEVRKTRGKNPGRGDRLSTEVAAGEKKNRVMAPRTTRATCAKDHEP